MTISVCVVAHNEENVLQGILSDIKKQTYPHRLMEIILIDSMSTDSTLRIMESFKNKEVDFLKISVLSNLGRRLASGWNVALKNYICDAIVRIDAHASIPEDFVEKNVGVLKSGEVVSGGIRPNIIEYPTKWTETLLLAEQSMFGSSIAPYRRSKEKKYVKSVFHGAYMREVFEKVGFFNEQLGRTEDNEMNYRIREAGYRLCYSPDIISYQHTRSSLKGMLKQKYGNGYWVALTLKACPKCLSIYHFVPLAFVFAIVVTSFMSFTWTDLWAIIMWLVYWGGAVIMACLAVKGKEKNITQVLLPVLFFMLHISYGIGSLVGLVRLPFWKYRRPIQES